MRQRGRCQYSPTEATARCVGIGTWHLSLAGLIQMPSWGPPTESTEAKAGWGWFSLKPRHFLTPCTWTAASPASRPRFFQLSGELFIPYISPCLLEYLKVFWLFWPNLNERTRGRLRKNHFRAEVGAGDNVQRAEKWEGREFGRKHQTLCIKMLRRKEERTGRRREKKERGREERFGHSTKGMPGEGRL